MREIIKQGITLALYIDEVADRDLHGWDIPRMRLKGVQRATRKFLKNMIKLGYNKVKDEWGETYYKRIEDHLKSTQNEDNDAVYLIYIRMQVHDFLRKYIPETIGTGNFHRNVHKVSYYESTLRGLLG